MTWWRFKPPTSSSILGSMPLELQDHWHLRRTITSLLFLILFDGSFFLKYCMCLGKLKDENYFNNRLFV